MAVYTDPNTYAHFLKAQGKYGLTVKDVNWYDYGGFMIPAYLPHCCPNIDERMAKEVLIKSGRAFVRWDNRFGEVENSPWWYVLKRGPWQIESIKRKKKRWMIRQGEKHFSVRPLTFDEVLEKCPKVAQLAVARYKGKAEVETYEILKERIRAANKVPGVLDYIGCFHEDTLVSFSENYIQEDAVWLTNIRHDPAFLNKYSSYGFMSGILDYYLNERKMDYVLDGWRSIYHKTQIQDHLISVFGFTKEYAVVYMLYSARLGLAVTAAYPFRNLVWALSNRLGNNMLNKAGAILRQEHIRRSCASI